MREQLEQAQRVGAPTMSGGSTTGGGTEERPSTNAAVHALFGSLPDPMRLRLEMVARSAPDQATALTRIIELLLEDASPAKRVAIVQAFTNNDSLREQWQRAWSALRA